MAVAALAEVHLRHRVDAAERVAHVDQHRDLDRVAGDERDPLEAARAARPPRRRAAGRSRRARGRRRAAAGAPSSSVTRPPPSGSSSPSGHERPAVAPFTNSARRARRQRPEQAVHEVRREVARVGVDEDHDVAARDRERAPHRVALAEHRAELGQQLGLLVAPRRPRRAATSAVPSRGGGVHHEHLVDQRRRGPQPLDDRPDRVRPPRGGEHHGDRLALGSSSRSSANSVWWKERITRAYYAQAVASPPTTYPWEPVLETGRDERLVATARDGEPGRARASRSRTTSTPRCCEALAAAGIEALYSHQADALEAAWRGHTIVTTGTASGKSLAFNLPVLDTLARDPRARALYLYPTKALAQDQARKLHELRGAVPAPRDLRRRHAARGAPRDPPALEPDPHEPGHAARRASCRTTARGATCWPTSPGSWSTRRTSTAACSARTWRTCCAGCGGSRAPTAPSRASCSRARRSPTRAELAERLTGLDFELVDRDGAPRAERQVAMWNPPLLDEKPGRRASALSEAAEPARRRWSSTTCGRSAS